MDEIRAEGRQKKEGGRKGRAAQALKKGDLQKRRKRVEEDGDNTFSLAQHQQPQHHRKRIRPKKAIDRDEEERRKKRRRRSLEGVVSTNGNGEPARPKRGPGRPRKHAKPVVVEEEQEGWRRGEDVDYPALAPHPRRRRLLMGKRKQSRFGDSGAEEDMDFVIADERARERRRGRGREESESGPQSSILGKITTKEEVEEEEEQGKVVVLPDVASMESELDLMMTEINEKMRALQEKQQQVLRMKQKMRSGVTN